MKKFSVLNMLKPTRLATLWLTVVFIGLLGVKGWGNSIYITTSINWTQITGGSGTNGQPGSSDDIYVIDNSVLTVDASSGVCKSITLGSNNNKEGTLKFLNSTSKITVSGTVNFIIVVR